MREKEVEVRNQIAEVFLRTPDEEMYTKVLKIVLEAVESKFGVFGYIDEKGDLVVPTMTRTVWDKCQVPDKQTVFKRENWGDSAWPVAIREKRTIWTNEPSVKIPQGHIKIFNHVALPVIHQDLVVGLIQVANKRSDYKQEDIKLLETIASAVAPVLNARLERDRKEKERQKLEDAVRQTQKLESLGVLAGGIAHDFNNILMGVLGNADLAQIELSPVSPAYERIEDMIVSVRRAADLCKQMLAYSGKGRFVVENINLMEIVEEMAHMLAVSISKKAVLKYNFAENLPSVKADATQMRQIIMNLITNASEAIGDRSGVISINTGAMDCDRSYLSESYLDENLPEGLYTYVEVADTGHGMSKDTKEKLFDPFYTTKFTGRGLGLSAVLGIVRGHKGAIKVYSESGKGTTFKVLFPAVDEPANSIKSAANNEADDWQGSGTILLVDDEESVLSVGKRFVEKKGFEVLTAADGREGLEVFREHANAIVCVILDLTMPHMDGEAAYREIRRIRKDTPIIMASGYNEQEITQRFVGKGLAGFIQKPYQSRDLWIKLREVLERT